MSWWHWLIVAGLAVGVLWNHGLATLMFMAAIIGLLVAENRGWLHAIAQCEERRRRNRAERMAWWDSKTD